MNMTWADLKGKPLTEIAVPVVAETLLRMPKDGEQGGFVRLRIGEVEITVPYTSLQVVPGRGYIRGEVEVALYIAVLEIVPELRQ